MVLRGDLHSDGRAQARAAPCARARALATAVASSRPGRDLARPARGPAAPFCGNPRGSGGPLAWHAACEGPARPDENEGEWRPTDMQTTTQTNETTPTTGKRSRTPTPMNGVDTPTLFATIGAVRAQPELARFRFRATNTWIQGTHSRSRLETFEGAGGSHRHVREFSVDADHPKVLVGRDQGPTLVEFLLHALAACITAGIGNIAAARGVTLYEVESTVEGDIDLRGILGISAEVRNGYRQLRVSFRIKGDAPAEKLREIVAQSQARSAVYDVLRNGAPVAVSVNAK